MNVFQQGAVTRPEAGYGGVRRAAAYTRDRSQIPGVNILTWSEPMGSKFCATNLTGVFSPEIKRRSITGSQEGSPSQKIPRIGLRPSAPMGENGHA